MNQTLDIIKTRRSVRSFKESQIPKAELEEIITCGLYAPSARNTQNWQFTVVQDENSLEELRKAIGEAVGNPDYPRFYNAPTLIIVSAPKDYKHAMADCACALENMFLAANSLGLGSVWINQLLDTGGNAKIRELLTKFKIPAEHNVCGCAAIGYPAESFGEKRENKGKVVYV